jgi:hypothetical protein
VRDGLTRIERVVLHTLYVTQREFKGRSVPTSTLYGRVVEHVDLSVDELQAVLVRLIGHPALRFADRPILQGGHSADEDET